MRLFHAIFLLALLVGCIACSERDQAQPRSITVALAASSLPSVQEVSRQFTRKTGIEVVLSSSASGLIARQIREGAPYDVFLSANADYTKQLAEEGFLDPKSVHTFVQGVLVLAVAPQYGGNVPQMTAVDTDAWPVKRLAIANPAHAPYGVAARQVLQNLGRWDGLQSRIVLGETVGQAYQFTSSGNVDAGLVPLSLAITGKVAYQEIDPALYEPIDHTTGITTASTHADEAGEFLRYLSSPEATAVFERYGFRVPKEAAP